MMNEFRLFAHGVSFDPDSYLADAPLTFDGVWRRGESDHDHPASSGVFKVLGDGTSLPDLDQERIAIEYLSTNRQGLKELAQYPGVTTFILGLQRQMVLESNTLGIVLSPSAQLMRLCLDIGVSLAYYCTFDRENE
jgi:hypothetical protein